MIPVVFNLGPIPINSFGLLMVLAILAAWKRLEIDFQESNLPAEIAEKVVFWSALGGFLGARALFILSNIDLLMANPIDTLLGGAGFVYWGGFVGGTLGLLYSTRDIACSALEKTDLCVIAVSLAYAVGRLGCQLSGDGDYGVASNVPWAMSYYLGVFPSEAGMLHHPTPVYESISAFLICFLLLFLKKTKKQSAGVLTGSYILLAAASRFLVEYLRIEPEVALSLTQAQLFSIALVPIGIALCLIGSRKKLKS